VSKLLAESRIIETVARGGVLEVTFRGVHKSGTSGREMERLFQDAVAGKTVAAILFNLLEYDCVAGRDVYFLFTAPWSGTATETRIRPVCIVASSRTRSSLFGFCSDAHFLEVFPIEFADTVEMGLLRLRTRLAEPDDPRLPADTKQSWAGARARAGSVPEPRGRGNQTRNLILMAVAMTSASSFITSHSARELFGTSGAYAGGALAFLLLAVGADYLFRKPPAA